MDRRGVVIKLQDRGSIYPDEQISPGLRRYLLRHVTPREEA